MHLPAAYRKGKTYKEEPSFTPSDHQMILHLFTINFEVDGDAESLLALSGKVIGSVQHFFIKALFHNCLSVPWTVHGSDAHMQ